MTQAETTKHQFESATKTISVVVLAARNGADRIVTSNGTVAYNFPDSSQLFTRGRGNAHQIWL